MAEENKTEKKELSTVPEYKKELVKKIVEMIKSKRTVLVASTKGLPASQFQKIKKNLRGKVEIVMAKKSIILRAIGNVEKGSLQNLKKSIGADICLMFSELEPYELAGILADSQSAAKAKAGDIAPEDINVEPGPTELIPGPAISELGAVGLKIKVENGKLAIVHAATIAKEGEVIDEKVAGVMGKLGIEPMKVGFLPIAAFDAENDAVYTEIKIDKEGALAELRNAIGKALGFAINIGHTVKETISYFIAKAGAEEKALSAKVALGEEKPVEEEKKEESNGNAETATGGSGEDKGGEAKEEEKPAEEKSEEKVEEKKEEPKEEEKVEEKTDDKTEKEDK